jgi:hypothetical protein
MSGVRRVVTEVKVDGRKRSERATEVCKGSTEDDFGCAGIQRNLGPHQLFVLATVCKCAYNPTRYRSLSILAAVGRPTSSHRQGNGRKRVCGYAVVPSASSEVQNTIAS